jgi:hypothetical protein
VVTRHGAAANPQPDTTAGNSNTSQRAGPPHIVENRGNSLNLRSASHQRITPANALRFMRRQSKVLSFEGGGPEVPSFSEA